MSIGEQNTSVKVGGRASGGGAPPPRESFTTLEASRIRIGDTLLMQSSPETPRLAVKLIGYLKNAGVIVTVPTNGGELVMLKDGQSFIVRFFSGQSAHAFTATVVRQTSVPFPHVHLSYPREVRGQGVRKGARIDVDLIAAISVLNAEGAELSRSGKIVNLSTGGAALRAKESLGQKGDVIGVKFKILTHDIPSYLDFASGIRLAKQDPEGDPSMPYLYGIEFDNADQGMSLALAAFVYQKIFHES